MRDRTPTTCRRTTTRTPSLRRVRLRRRRTPPRVERRTELAGIKLRRVYDLRDHGDPAGARTLLYEVLEEGDADQRMVARNILNQLDT